MGIGKEVPRSDKERKNDWTNIKSSNGGKHDITENNLIWKAFIYLYFTNSNKLRITRITTEEKLQ